MDDIDMDAYMRKQQEKYNALKEKSGGEKVELPPAQYGEDEYMFPSETSPETKALDRLYKDAPVHGGPERSIDASPGYMTPSPRKPMKKLPTLEEFRERLYDYEEIPEEGTFDETPGPRIIEEEREVPGSTIKSPDTDSAIKNILKALEDIERKRKSPEVE